MQVSLLSPDGLTERCLATFGHVIFTFFGETSTALKLCMTSLSQFHIRVIIQQDRGIAKSHFSSFLDICISQRSRGGKQILLCLTS